MERVLLFLAIGGAPRSGAGSCGEVLLRPVPAHAQSPDSRQGGGAGEVRGSTPYDGVARGRSAPNRGTRSTWRVRRDPQTRQGLPMAGELPVLLARQASVAERWEGPPVRCVSREECRAGRDSDVVESSPLPSRKTRAGR